MNLSCFFDPAACATGVADSIVSLFPYGVLGVAFTAGLIIGAIVGKWGVGALIALVVAVKLGSNHRTEPFAGTPFGETPPKPARRVRLPFGTKRKLKGLFGWLRKE